MLDGIVARMLHTSSDFGVELDSLSDVISFGFAPSFLLYNLYFKDLNTAGLLISSMILIFAAIRLARFNTNLVGYSKDSFYGLPTPMASLIICSYVMFIHGKEVNERTGEIILIVITIATALLMVSKIKFTATPPINKRTLKEKKFTFIILALSLIVVLATKGKAIFPLTIIYLLEGIIRTLFFKEPQKRHLKKKV